MEIALGREAEPELAVSLPLGAGRLTRAFLPDDPPAKADVKALRRHIRSTLREVTDRLLWEGAPACAIGSSKTFKQLARLTGSPPQRKGPFVPRWVEAAELDRWLPRLAKMSSKKRAKLRGVQRSRAEQLLDHSAVYPPSPKWGGLEGANIFDGEIQKVMKGQATPQQAVAELAKKMDQEVAG